MEDNKCSELFYYCAKSFKLCFFWCDIAVGNWCLKKKNTKIGLKNVENLFLIRSGAILFRKINGCECCLSRLDWCCDCTSTEIVARKEAFFTFK